MYPQRLLRDFSGQVLKAAGQEPEMGAVAKAFGYANPVEMVKGIYRFSGNNLWFWNDVMLMQAFLEREAVGEKNLVRNIQENEKHIPNYRTATSVLGSVQLSRALNNPAVFAFGKYDYARMASYGHMVRDAIGKDRTIKERAHALDQMAALAVVSFIIYPFVVDQVAKAVTGNPNASVQRFGASTLPAILLDWWHGEKDYAEALQSAFPPSPAAQLLFEVANNVSSHGKKELFSGGDEFGDWAQNAISPLGDINRWVKGKTNGEELALKMIGVKAPSAEKAEKAAAWKEKRRQQWLKAAEKARAKAQGREYLR
jgi:hypothetical protein